MIIKMAKKLMLLPKMLQIPTTIAGAKTTYLASYHIKQFCDSNKIHKVLT